MRFTPYWDTLAGKKHMEPRKGTFLVAPYHPTHWPFSLHPAPALGKPFSHADWFSFSAATGDTAPPFQNLRGRKAQRMIRSWVAFWVWLIWFNVFNVNPCCDMYHNCFIHLFVAVRNTSHWAFKPFQYTAYSINYTHFVVHIFSPSSSTTYSFAHETIQFLYIFAKILLVFTFSVVDFLVLESLRLWC